MIVMKFGGTSVGTAERIRQACQIVKDRLPRKPFVVVSAHNSPSCRMTDTLVDSAKKALEGHPDPSRVSKLQRGICKDLGIDTSLIDHLLEEFSSLLTGIYMIGEISPRTMDHVMSFGERMSCLVVAEVMKREFVENCVAATSFDLGLRTDDVFGDATPDESSYLAIRENVEKLNADVVITTGFLAKGPSGHITTLGRGGSDFSGTIFGAALGAKEVEIWTDVDGVMTTDPKITPSARTIPEMTFREASELSWYGAKVLHPSTMIPAIKHGIPVRVLNTMHPDYPGTVIKEALHNDATVAKSVVYKSGITLLTITSGRMVNMPGFMARVFQTLGKHDVDIHMIATSEVSISLSTPYGVNVETAAEELKQYGEVKIEHNMAIVCVIGQNMAGTPGVASRVTNAMAKNKVNIHMISQGACELNIALLLDKEDATTAVKALHDEFFPNDK